MILLRSSLVVALWTALVAAGGQDDRPLPDRATFLEEARKRLTSDEELQSQYTFKERRIKLSQTADGSYEPEETRLYEVYPSLVPDLTYLRLVQSDGRPTPARELLEADRRQLAQLSDYVRRVRSESTSARQRRLAKEEEALATDKVMIQDVVSVLQFDLVRRETLGGRSTIVIEFGPVEHPKPATREGKVVSHFRGLVWVDEEELQVVRAEAEAIDTISFGLGIVARLHDNLRGEFVRRQVADGTWLPARAELTGTGRMLLFKKLDLAWIYEYFDYERIDPASPPRFIALPGDVRPEPRRLLAPPSAADPSARCVARHP